MELLSFIGSYNDKVAEVIDKTPKNATYISSEVQKEILQVMASKIKNVIHEKIDDAKFCIIIDEARDHSKKEQMSIVMRFVDKNGYVQERFFGLVHVRDTIASTLKEAIFSVLSRHNLDFHNIQGQGYDGASNMRGEWNSLQVLISNKCYFICHLLVGFILCMLFDWFCSLWVVAFHFFLFSIHSLLCFLIEIHE